MSEYECAVWFWRYQVPDYDLFETEQEAAEFAVGMEDNCNGAASGVQFRDGRLIKRDDWVALRTAEADRNALYIAQAEARANATPPPTRVARDPFSGTEIKVELSEPDWVGLPVPTSP